ncbi:MAG: ATP-binding cassette domain-containing protein [Pyrinomonadaceae bacterium]|nr:ATP-binding cassette domain-containing protein [Pyrinomonadaceae bacterium]
MSLTVSEISKRFGSNWILRNVSFVAEKGSVTGIFGANGSGKSTLLRLLAGLETSNGGSFSVNGSAPAASNSTDAFVYVLSIPASPFLQRALGKAVNDAAKRQEEAIMTAVNGAETAVLLDDAFCLFDDETKDAIFANVRRAAAERGLTVVFATSDFNDVLAYCDRVTVIANRYVVQEGTPEEIYDAPENCLVARLTGRHNLIEARRLSSNKTELPEFHTIAGEHRLHAHRGSKSELGAINQNVWLAIRPEQLSISFGASFPEDNLIKAAIAGIKFLGPLTLVDLDAGGLTLQAYVPRLIGLNIGDECMVGLPPDRIRILKS